MQPIQSDVQIESFYTVVDADGITFSTQETEDEALTVAKQLADMSPGVPFYVMRPAFVAFVGSIVLATE